MVAHDVGAFTNGPLVRGVCALQTSYSVDLWVTKTDLGAHGVRNYKVTGTSMICPP